MVKIVKNIEKILFTSGLEGMGWQTIEARPIKIIETTEEVLVYRNEKGIEIDLPESVSYSIIEEKNPEIVEGIKSLIESE